jgi:hypothetical protein
MIVNGFKIHSELLEEVYAERCVLHECLGTCCTGGAWLDVEQLKIIVPQVAAIKANLPADRHDVNAWFSAPADDEAAPDGDLIGMNVVADPDRPGESCCVFLRPDRLCALQVTSQQLGLDFPGLKPLFCALYPLQIRGDEILFDHDTEQNFGGANCRRACVAKQPLYQIFQTELELILGVEGYQELRIRSR